MIQYARLHRLYALLAVLGAVLLVGFGFGVADAAIEGPLSPGMSGDSVRELQIFLAADSALYPEGLITGYYGSLTVAAVQRFQCREGIACSGTVQSTGYGRVGPVTRARILTLMGGANPGVDASAPVMFGATVATTSTSATISWTASEAATHRVMYGTSWPFIYATAPSIASSGGRSSTASVTITGLVPNTRYFFVRESVDASGNIQWTVGESFRTGN